jgi:hypothetical protein
MRSLWDPEAADQILARLDRLTPDTTPRWGRFSCSDMLAHLNEWFRMALGEISPAPKRVPIRFFPLKQLIIYVLPFPKGVPTAPELIARSGRAVWSDEVRSFRELLGRVAKCSAETRWPTHPAFGSMTRRSWGVLGYRHLSHHFTQFGV